MADTAAKEVFRPSRLPDNTLKLRVGDDDLGSITANFDAYGDGGLGWRGTGMVNVRVGEYVVPCRITQFSIRIIGEPTPISKGK